MPEPLSLGSHIGHLDSTPAPHPDRYQTRCSCDLRGIRDRPLVYYTPAVNRTGTTCTKPFFFIPASTPAHPTPFRCMGATFTKPVRCYAAHRTGSVDRQASLPTP